ncbi:MAG: metallophosphoesterase [Nitrospirota bacterium]
MSLRSKISGKFKLVVLPLAVYGIFGLSPFWMHKATPAPDVHLTNQSASSLKDIKTPFKFVVIGDNRTGVDIYKKFVTDIVKDSPVLVVNTGDVIADGGSGKEWTEFVNASAPLTMPYFLAPGNHEINGRTAEDFYKQEVRQPGTGLYYSFDAGNCLFLVLDSEQPGHVAKVEGEQYAFAEEQLKNSDKKFKFVFIHRPLYPGKFGMHLTDSLNSHKELRDRLESLFEKYKVTVLFCGHEHMYNRQYVNGVTHIITGGGGAPLYTSDKRGGFHHYVLVSVNDDSVCIKVIDDKGNIRDEFSIVKDAA